MRWRSLFVSVLLCIAVSADTSRPRRDLQTILKIKDAIASKIFGFNNSDSEKPSAMFYRIPGHENILIKAVPIELKINQGAEMIDMPASPQNPTLALLESYLETNTADDTLKALQRAQTLIQSGILNDQSALNRLLDRSPYRGQISSCIAQDRFLNPGALQTPFPAPRKPFSMLTSGIHYFGAPIVGPTQNSYDVPIFSQPILFKDSKSFRPPVVPHHPIITGVRPETRIPAVVYRAFHPFFEDQKVSVAGNRPDNVKKNAKPASSYSYTQHHRNGAVSTYGERMPAELAKVRPLVLQRITDITNNLPNLGRPHIHGSSPRFSAVQDNFHGNVLNVPKQGGYSYKQVHNDGSATIYNNGTPVGPVVVELPPKTSRLVKKFDGGGGYYFERINDDGSVTQWLDSEGRVPVPLNFFQNKPLVMQSIAHDRIKAVAGAPSKPAHVPPKISTQVNNSAGNNQADKNNYSYQQINSDGSVSSFHGSQATAVNHTSHQVVTPKPVRLPPPAVPQVELEHTVIIGAPLGSPVVTLLETPAVLVTDTRGQDPVNVFPFSGDQVLQYPVHIRGPSPPPSQFHIQQHPRVPLPSDVQQFAPDVSAHKITNFIKPVHMLPLDLIGSSNFIYKQLQKDGSLSTQTASGKGEGSQNLHVNSVTQKETKGAFVKPILGNYVYKQIVHNNPNFTVVNVEPPSSEHSPPINSRFGSQGSYSYNQEYNNAAISGKPATDKPLTDYVKVVFREDSVGTHSASGNFQYVQTNSPNATTAAATSINPEDSLENNPIIVSDGTKAPAAKILYNQYHDDKSPISFQSSNENHITVLGDYEKEHQRGDIP